MLPNRETNPFNAPINFNKMMMFLPKIVHNFVCFRLSQRRKEEGEEEEKNKNEENEKEKE